MNAPKLIIAGGSGFLGRALAAYFHELACDVCVLTRTPTSDSTPPPDLPPANCRKRWWDGRTLGEWANELEDATALVNLAGRSVDCRYHARNRRLIMDSRVESTRVLGEAVARCARPPKVWLNSSTATIYKHSLDTPRDEAGLVGATPEAKDAFSIEVAQAWERTFAAAVVPRTRKVALRTAMVLGQQGGVFPALCRLARCGLGGPMATGKQFVSWIHELDFCRAVEWLIQHHEIDGIVNLAAPGPLPNREMMSIVRRACSVPFGLPAGQWMLEVGAFFIRTETELIIKSRRVIPGRLLTAGFDFWFSEFSQAIEDLLQRQRRPPAMAEIFNARRLTSEPRN
ncbi:MAG TPA: TIGR01777 family oxidoreductase [Verrucomicrobiae bacterium]|nr:TIGR01777 family oxidoreductase [Verrucomicrobiae bacterium]